MANMTTGLENKLVDGVTGVSTLLSPAMYMCLLTADPTEAGLVTNELSGDGYARIPLVGLFGSAVDGVASNTSAVTSALATAQWVEATYIGYCRGATAGVADMEVWALLAIPTTVLIGTSFSVDIGGLTVTGE